MAYVIKKGDTLIKIAKQNGLTLKQLLSLNKNIENPDYIQIGQKINLTNSSPTGKKIYDNNDGYPITPKNIPPSWNKVTKGAGNPTTSAKFKKPVKENKDEIIKYYIDEMIKSGNKKIFITDKGTKKTYYGNASDYNGDLKSLNSFDVLTGVNDDPNFYKYDDTSVDDIDKSQNPSIHKVTPIGKYSLIYDQIYNKPGFRLPNTSIAYHTIYPGELENRKSKLLSQTPNDNNVSYGCINCNEPDIQKVSKFLNSGDSTYIIDSRLPLDKLKSILNPKNNKSGKIETEKKSTNKVIDFFRNIFENGGYAASDNIDMGYYTNPIKYFAAMGINISDDDCLECGGKVYANNGLNIDSTLNANKNLNWVDRLYQKNTPTIFLPGESHPSTHYMENADNFVYPTIIQNEDGKLEYLGNKAYDYAMKTNTAIKFKTPEEAEYFAKNYKKGKGVLKKFNIGGKIKAEEGLNPKPLIPLKPEQIDFEMERQLPREVPRGQELTQSTTNYYNWGNYGNQNSFLTPDQINQKPFQNTVPLANTNMPQNIGTNYFTPYDASDDRVHKDNQLASSMMKSSSKGLSNPVSMGLDIGGKSLDATANLLGSLGKDNSKAKAFGQGASGAMKVSDSITKPFESIPIAGKAIDAVGKTLGFFIGGALEARRQGIENEEMDKYNKLQEYTSRNTQTAQQPSYYGQYMSKYGSNIKNLEQRLIDDIFSDYDKFMKLT